jgi:hypothetical protein
VSGRICWKTANELEWLAEDLGFPSAVRSPQISALGSQTLDHINALLRDRQLEVGIEFGPYGNFYSSASFVKREHAQEIKLARSVRARVEWLCKASGTFVASHQKPLPQLDDEALLELFAKLTVPASLLAHRRALDHEIQNVTKALKS